MFHPAASRFTPRSRLPFSTVPATWTSKKGLASSRQPNRYMTRSEKTIKHGLAPRVLEIAKAVDVFGD